MKAGGIILMALTAFLGVCALVYGILSHEWAGTAALTLSAGLTFLSGFYVLFTDRRLDDGPEDDPDAEVADGAGEIGFFSPHSWWPLALAASAAILTVGIVLAWWMVALGLGLIFASVFGLVFEYYRDEDEAQQV